MRIIAGAWRGRPLAAPAGPSTRPTSDRAREGLFSMLTSRLGSFEGLKVADLFAGTGALGLEALSRGAGHCLFVENDRAALAILQRNIATLGAASRTEVLAQSVEHARAPMGRRDLVMLDPPYASPLIETTLLRMESWLAPGAMVSIETQGPLASVPPAFSVEAERRFGKAYITLLRASA